MPDGQSQTTETNATPNMQMLNQQSNITASLDDYDVSSWSPTAHVVKEQAGYQQGQIQNLDEALAWKSYEEQVKILAELNAPKQWDGLKKDIDLFEPDLKPLSWKEPQEQTKQEEAKKEDDINLDAELDALLNEANKKAEEKAKADAEAKEWEEYEEITEEELDKINQELETRATRINELKSLDIENQKTINILKAQDEAKTSTIEYLKWMVKDLNSKVSYYEASSEVVKSDDEHSLIQLRRWATEDWASAREQYNYIMHLANECDKLTWSNLFAKTVNQMIQESVNKDNQKFVNDYAQKNIGTQPKVDDIDQYAV